MICYKKYLSYFGIQSGRFMWINSILECILMMYMCVYVCLIETVVLLPYNQLLNPQQFSF